MNAGLLSAAISAAALIAVAILTYLLTKWKEREADWRKIKLDLYRAYVVALSGTVKHNRTSEDQIKYADAVNSLTLVASPAVLKALYAFQDSTSDTNRTEKEADVESRLDNLLNALRQDINRSRRSERGNLSFRFMAPPPDRVGDQIDPSIGP